jgi:DNA-binding CsgD family transcriptional regulator
VTGTILHKIGADDPAILLVLTPLDLDASGRAEALHALHGLTRVERRMATDLVSGMSVSAIAEARNLSVQTVRWHTKNLIEKIGAQSLSDLQRILALLLPL